MQLAGAGAAFGLACLVVKSWIRFSQRMAIVDRPTARSSHTRATPRGGGVGIVVAALVGGVLPPCLSRPGLPAEAIWAGGLALAVAAISLVDDIRSLPSLARLIFHLAAATTAVVVLGAFAPAGVPGLADWQPPSLLLPALTVVWIVGLTNVYNFMDGIDGIAGSQGVIAGLAWTWYGAHVGAPVVTGCGLALAAACAGFLVYNWAPARVFMGDVGSAFLGFAFAVLPLLVVRETRDAAGSSGSLQETVVVFALLTVWPFVADGFFTFVRRLRYRENLLNAHRSHLYQRLTIVGWGHAAVARLYAGWAAVCALLGVMYVLGGPSARAFGVGAAAGSLVGVYLLVKRAEGSVKSR